MAEIEEFKIFLKTKLKSLKIDETVFSTYILSILEDEETLEEKQSALEELLETEDANKHIKEILDKWNNVHPAEPAPTTNNIKKDLDIDVQLAKILESKVLTSNSKQKKMTAEEKRIKEQILAQYSQCSDKEEDDEEIDPVEEEQDPNLVKNTNKADVQSLIKEKREQAKIESQKKKEKDREDREKQRQMRDEKKEKRKTVKQERKR